VDRTEVEPGTVALTRLLDAGRGLGFGVRLRIALDVLAAVADTAGADTPLRPRGAGSRLVLGCVHIDDCGQAHVAGEGEDSGAGELVWEILAGREIGDGQATALFDCTDDVTVRVSELVARALDGNNDLMRVEQLLAALEDAGRDYLDVHEDVKQSIGPASSWAPSNSMPAPAPPSLPDEVPCAEPPPPEPALTRTEAEVPPQAEPGSERVTTPGFEEDPAIEVVPCSVESVAIEPLAIEPVPVAVAQPSTVDASVLSLDDDWDFELPPVRAAAKSVELAPPASPPEPIEAAPEVPAEAAPTDDAPAPEAATSSTPGESSLERNDTPEVTSLRPELPGGTGTEDLQEEPTQVMRFELRARDGRRGSAENAIAGLHRDRDEDADDAEPTALLRHPRTLQGKDLVSASERAFNTRVRDRLLALRSDAPSESAESSPVADAEPVFAGADAPPPSAPEPKAPVVADEVPSAAKPARTSGKERRKRRRTADDNQAAPREVSRSSPRGMRVALAAVAGAVVGVSVLIYRQITQPHPDETQPPATATPEGPRGRRPPLPRGAASTPADDAGAAPARDAGPPGDRR